MASYVRRLGTGRNARKTVAIAWKSVTHPRRLEIRQVRFQVHRLALFTKAQREQNKLKTG